MTPFKPISLITKGDLLHLGPDMMNDGHVFQIGPGHCKADPFTGNHLAQSEDSTMILKLDVEDGAGHCFLGTWEEPDTTWALFSAPHTFSPPLNNNPLEVPICREGY